MKNRITIKQEAKSLIRTGRVSPILMSVILLVIVTVLDYISSWFGYGTITGEDLQYMLESGDVSMLLESTQLSSPMQPFVPILVSLVTSVLYAGYYSFLMGIYRGKEMGYASLLDGFGIVGKVIWCELLVAIKIFLWSLLFVIPGIIAAYRYRFAMYNLLRDNSLTVSRAIALSCKQTEGLKFELFVLDLSFIGWNLLNILTFNILSVWVMPYTVLSDLGYYNEALGRMGNVSENEEPPKNDFPWEV